jgi:hypothetical protein
MIRLNIETCTTVYEHTRHTKIREGPVPGAILQGTVANAESVSSVLLGPNPFFLMV